MKNSRCNFIPFHAVRTILLVQIKSKSITHYAVYAREFRNDRIHTAGPAALIRPFLTQAHDHKNFDFFLNLVKKCNYIKPSDKKSDIQTQLLFNICTIYASIFRDYVGARRFERRFKICELLGFVSSRSIGWLAKGYFTVANVVCFLLYLKNCLNSFTEAITR